MLTNSLKISDTTKTEFFVLIFFLNDKKIWQKYFRAYLSSVPDPLTCCLSISVITRGFLGIHVTLLFAVYNFRNKEPLNIIFFFKVFEILCRFCKGRKTGKIFFDFQIIAFELVPLHTRFYCERILVMGCQYVNKQSQDYGYY